MFVSKGKAGPWAHLLYEVRYSDGTTKTERGAAVHAWPGLRDCNPWMVPKSQKELQKLQYRPDLGTIIEMVVIGCERISSACYSVDTYKPKKKGKKRG